MIRPTRILRDKSTIMVRAAWLLLAASSLTACGGGNSVGTGPEPSPPLASASSVPPASPGSVTVSAVTSAGAPIGGITVNLNGGFDGRTATTDPEGQATFINVPVGDVNTNLGGAGYHWAGRRFTVTQDSATKVAVQLVPVTEATPVVLATRPVASIDGRILTVDVDLAVLDQSSVPLQTLVDGDFQLNGACDWGWCVLETDGSDTYRYYTARVIDAAYHPAPSLPRAILATAILLDQSADTAVFDPSGMRLQAVNDFFKSIAAPDTVALGSYQGTAATPIVATYGGFTSDAASLGSSVRSLAGQERGTSPLHAALSEMIAFTAANSPAGSSELQRSVVAVTSSWPMTECQSAATCWQAKLAITAKARASGVSVIAIGSDGPAAEIAARTDGAFAFVSHPAQLPIVFNQIDSIIGRSLAYTRVRIELDSGQAGSFLPGRTVQGYLRVRIAPDTYLSWYLTIPL